VDAAAKAALPHSEWEVPVNVPVLLSSVNIFSVDHDGNLVLLDDDPGRVIRSQITSVVCQIQRFDFDCNMVVTRKLITWIPPPLRSKPLYIHTYRR
jgi:hypothetical protein